MMNDTQSLPFNALKVPYDSLTLRGVVTELRGLLVGGQIQEIRQPTPTEVTLSIRHQNRTHVLLLSIDAQFARAHLTTRRRANPPTPPNFCMVLRKYLEDMWIRDLRQTGFDRVLEIEAGLRNQEDEAPPVTLVAELMGKHSNLILVNAEGTIIDSAKRISKRINRVREVLPGLAYRLPPTQADKVDPLVPDAVPFLVKELGLDLDIDRQKLVDTLLLLYGGISPFLAREMAARLVQILAVSGNGAENSNGQIRPASQEALRLALEQVWNDTLRSVTQGSRAQATLIRDTERHPLGAYPLRVLQAANNLNLVQDEAPSLNAALDEAFGFQIDRAGFGAIAGELRGQLQQETKRSERQQQSVSRTLAEAERSEQYKQTGELIFANLWRIEPSSKEIVVQDYYDPAFPDRAIELDPRLSAQENADHYFKRYRKARDAEERALEESVRLEDHLADLKVATAALNNAKTEEDLRTLRADLLARNVLRPLSASAERERSGSESEFAGHKIRRYTVPPGYEILVGENATSNDYLTLRVAAPNDWWLHVRAAVSAHVVVRTHGKPYEVPRPVLERAAQLCAQHSQQKHSSLVSVDYTLKKYVRRPRGSAPGAADYQNEMSIDVTPS